MTLEQPPSEERATASPLKRFIEFLKDGSERTHEIFDYIRHGGERPSLLPPSPRRVRQEYWEE